MPDPTTPNIGLILPTHGEYVESWDSAVANPNYSTIDKAFGGQAAVALTSGATITLTQAQAACAFIQFTGSISANTIVVFPTGFGGRRMIFNGGMTFSGDAALVLELGGAPTFYLAVYAAWGFPFGVMAYPGWGMTWDNPLPIGTIIDYAGGGGTTPSTPYLRAPPGYLLCDGSLTSAPQYALLYDYLGDNWRGTNPAAPAGNFHLPDFRGCVLAGADTMMGGGSAARLYGWGVGVVGSTTVGKSTTTLSIANMPSHTHPDSGHIHGVSASQDAHTHTFSIPGSFGGGVGPNAAFNPLVNSGSIGETTAGASANNVYVTISTGFANISYAGGGAAWNSIQPTGTVNKMIRC
jgi:microcystin-dependent protein